MSAWSLLEILPKGCIHSLGTGINDNFPDKARKLGIPVWTLDGT